jgi:hypothetical protein
LRTSQIDTAFILRNSPLGRSNTPELRPTVSKLHISTLSTGVLAVVTHSLQLEFSPFSITIFLLLLLSPLPLPLPAIDRSSSCDSHISQWLGPRPQRPPKRPLLRPILRLRLSRTALTSSGPTLKNRTGRGVSPSSKPIPR